MKIKPRRPPDMEARFVTRDNLADVAAWCGGKIVGEDIDRPEVELPDERDPDYADWAKPGEYAIKGVTGRYWAVDSETFARDYEVLPA